MKEDIKEVHDEFVRVFTDCERFAFLARGKEFQLESCEKLNQLQERIKEVKNLAIQESDEESANRLLHYEMVAKTLFLEMKMWLSFKDNAPESAWGFLVEAQGSLRAALLAYDVGDILDSYVEKLSSLEELLFPKMIFASIGFRPIKKTCNICSKDYETCEHVKGRPYMGKLCHAIIEKSELEEVSWVEEPANKHCRALTISQGGVTRNAMTWEVQDDEEGTNLKD